MRGRQLLLTGWLIVGLLMTTAACAGEEARNPTLPSIDFTPKLVLTVDESGLRATRGPRGDDRVRTDPPAVPSGAVIEIVNAGQKDHRLQGGATFDTGIMRPGERTTVVVTPTTGDTAGGTGADGTKIDIADPLDASIKATLTVLADSTPTN